MKVLAIEQKEKNGEGRGGYYLEKKIFGPHRGGGEDQRRKRWRKILRSKYLVHCGEEERRMIRSENFGELKYLVCGGEKQRRRKSFGEGEFMVTSTN